MVSWQNDLRAPVTCAQGVCFHKALIHDDDMITDFADSYSHDVIILAGSYIVTTQQYTRYNNDIVIHYICNATITDLAGSYRKGTLNEGDEQHEKQYDKLL